jgi:hypothetical protein
MVLGEDLPIDTDIFIKIKNKINKARIDKKLSI